MSRQDSLTNSKDVEAEIKLKDDEKPVSEFPWCIIAYEANLIVGNVIQFMLIKRLNCKQLF